MVDRRNFLAGGAAMAGLMHAGASQLSADEKPAPAGGVRGYDFAAPDFDTGSRLLFQGDSITDMKWGRNEKDRNHYLGHSYVFLLASRLGVEMPAAKLDFYNRGISGNTVGDLQARWEKDAIAMKPDLLSILVGVNDVGRNARANGPGVDLQKWEASYREILTRSRKANPALRLVLLDPFVLRSGKLTPDAAWKAWRTEVDKLCKLVSGIAKDFAAVHIQTQQIFDNAAQAVSPQHWLWDGVHPLPQGHELIARHWLQAVSERWPAKA